jgi:O-phospho-L-seryl-tRNASec:L-selenocysteinyl-tRNA synthase
VAKLCQQAGIAHIINNAYGVQSAALCSQVSSAWRKGRVDAVVQSTDKNFQVPVGGAIIAARRGATQLVSAQQRSIWGSWRAAEHRPPCLPS